MVSMAAAKILNAEADEVTIAIDKAVQAEWRVLCHNRNVVKSSQMSVRLSKPRRTRTVGYRSQNHRIHGHSTQIASRVGEAKSKIIADAVDIAMGMNPDFPVYTDWRGKIVAAHESEWDTITAAAVCKALELIASEVDCELKEYDDESAK